MPKKNFHPQQHAYKSLSMDVLDAVAVAAVAAVGIIDLVFLVRVKVARGDGRKQPQEIFTFSEG